jgi:hypothetical protein
MKAALLAESNARNALATARDAATAAEWDYHNTLLGAKNQVIAQYGDGSDQLQSLGLKKKSEHKSPARRKKALAKKNTTSESFFAKNPEVFFNLFPKLRKSQRV